MHSNRICILRLAQTHPFFQSNSTARIKAVTYHPELCNGYSVRGKKKAGAKFVDHNFPLCTITCEDGSTLQIKSSMRGSILDKPATTLQSRTAADAPWREGYLAILSQRWMVAKIQRELSSEAEYCHSRGLEALHPNKLMFPFQKKAKIERT